MKTKTKFSYRLPEKRKANMDSVEIAALMGRPCPEVGTARQNELAAYRHMELELRILEGTGRARTIYEKHRVTVLGLWISKRAGTRPPCWWIFEAPPHDGISDRSSPEAQCRFLQSRGLLSKDEIKRIPKEWLAPKQPKLTVITGDQNGTSS